MDKDKVNYFAQLPKLTDTLTRDKVYINDEIRISLVDGKILVETNIDDITSSKELSIEQLMRLSKQLSTLTYETLNHYK